MKKNLLIALWFTLVTTVMFGVLYPLTITGLAQVLFPSRANGQLLERNGKMVGSRIIGQSFTEPGYFHSRPSSAGTGYDPTSSSGSNLGPTNKVLIERVKSDVQKLQSENPNVPIPVDLVTASGSGLDPNISPAAADFQIPRVAHARGMKEDDVRSLVHKHTRDRDLGFLGEPRVNVLELNLELVGRLKAVSQPGLGQDVAGMRRILLDLFTQLVDYHAEVLRGLTIIRPPNRLQHPLMRKRLPLLNDESAQDVEFLGSQVNSLATNVHDSSLEIDTQFRSLDLGKRLLRSEAPERGANARQQFSDGKRFYDVIVRPRIQGDDFVSFGVADRYHDDRPLVRQANLAAGLQPAHTGHVDIQENQIGALPDDHVDGLRAVLCLQDLVAVTGKRGSQDATDLRFVVDHENGSIVHGFSRCHPYSEVFAMVRNWQ